MQQQQQSPKRHFFYYFLFFWLFSVEVALQSVGCCHRPIQKPPPRSRHRVSDLGGLWRRKEVWECLVWEWFLLTGEAAYLGVLEGRRAKKGPCLGAASASKKGRVWGRFWFCNKTTFGCLAIFFLTKF